MLVYLFPYPSLSFPPSLTYPLSLIPKLPFLPYPFSLSPLNIPTKIKILKSHLPFPITIKSSKSVYAQIKFPATCLHAYFVLRMGGVG